VSPLTAVKLALAALGVAIFGYGVRIDSTPSRWVGVGLVAVAALLRFLRARPRDGT
jgi:hypothetical protein